MSKNLFLLAIVAFILMGCGTGYGLKKVEAPTGPEYSPNKDESAIVFYRSLLTGGAPALIFEVSDGQPKFVTISSIGTKILYKTSPGRHIYLMDGDFGYFMDAELEPGKIYYVYVSRRPGWVRDRFIFEPVSPADLEKDSFKQVFAKCDWYENSPEGEQLFLEKKSYITNRYKELIKNSAADGWSKATKMPANYGVTTLIQ